MKKLVTLFIIGLQFIALNAQEKTNVYTIVEKMPVYPGCEKENLKQAIQECTNKKIIEFVNENLEFPDSLNSGDHPGICYVSFIINNEGKVEGSKVLRGFKGEKGELLNEKALEVINKLPKMQPGMQRGEAVNVQYTIPVKFSANK